MTPTPDPALAALIAALLPLIEEQSCGEWGDELVADDAKKIALGLLPNFISISVHEAAMQAAVAKAVEAALREHTGRKETGESITEKYLRRYPRSKKTRAWEGAMVHLRTQNGIWRPDGHGYTLHFSEAWVLPLADARKIGSGIYEDHGGTYYHASAAILTRKGDEL